MINKVNCLLIKYEIKIFLKIIVFIIFLFIIKKKNRNIFFIVKQLKENDKDFLILKNINEKLINLEKEKLLIYLSKYTGKNITKVNSIFLSSSSRFGNKIILLINTIFYCHILGCKNIFLDKKKFLFIKKSIKIRKIKIAIKIKKQNEIKEDLTVIDKTRNFFNYNHYINTQYYLNIIKNEIISNLPKVKINKNDLYIYIRSGDIFIRPAYTYAQPPFCFYKKILNNYKFNNIYLIAENKNNPVINQLLIYFPNIIFNINKLEKDISLLINAYNIVGGAHSTFLDKILRLNTNLKFLWNFIFKKINKHQFNVINFYNLNNIIIFAMVSSNEYYLKMKFWNNTKSQRDLMINEQCANDFFISDNY